MTVLALDTLQMLYLKPRGAPTCPDPTERTLVKELRERYWIEQGEDVERENGWLDFGFRIPYSIERQDLGRNREQPGDGFRWVIAGSTTRTESRIEWFEVTEVFAGVDPKDVEAFMRVNNGLPAYPGFEPAHFLRGLDLGKPSRAAQRRAADQVLDAIDTKFRKPSYAQLTDPHGYGTLIVGLPLWFASFPANPSRDANVLDDFTTRVGIGLRRYRPCLADLSFPFWRIVVVWNASAQSLRDSKAKAKIEVFEDPAYRRIRDLPTKTFLGWALLDILADDADRTDADGPRQTMHLVQACRAKNKAGTLPPGIDELRANFENAARRRHAFGLAHMKWRVLRPALEIAAFANAHGFAGLRRWANTRMSPGFWIEVWVKARRQTWLLEESRRRSSARSSGSLATAQAARATAFLACVDTAASQTERAQTHPSKARTAGPLVLRRLLACALDRVDHIRPALPC